MNKAKEFVAAVANRLRCEGRTMTVPDLANALNVAGHPTTGGDPYVGKRGTYRLVKGVYESLIHEGRRKEAQDVADAFTKPDGTYANPN